MFRGPATLMRTNRQLKWVFGGAMVVCLVFAVALMLLPGRTKLIAIAVVVPAMIGVYPMLLSRGLAPQRVSVALYVDQTGVYADNAPLARRENIAQAYIRPALAARTQQHTSSGGSVPASYRLDLPSYPLTVELVLRRGGQLNIDPGGQGPAAEILTALGFPVTMCAPGHRAHTSGQRIRTIVVLVLFFAGAIGYYFYMSTRH
jgi:cyanate permease